MIAIMSASFVCLFAGWLAPVDWQPCREGVRVEPCKSGCTGIPWILGTDAGPVGVHSVRTL